MIYMRYVICACVCVYVYTKIISVIDKLLLRIIPTLSVKLYCVRPSRHLLLFFSSIVHIINK